MLEEDLVRRAQAGEQHAFRQLVETYSGLVERTARALLADRSLAEEAAQEAWLDVWRGLPRFQAGRPFRPWLLTIVANRCRMQARRRLAPQVPWDAALAETYGGAALPPGLPAGDGELHALLSTLRPDQQQVLVLRFYADLKLEEIARMTRTPVGTVKSRLHRALRTLRTQLQADQPAPHGAPKGVEL